MRKGEERKVLLAALLRQRTSVGVSWIAESLVMGHPGSVSRLIGGIERDVKLKRQFGELEEMLGCGD